MRRFRRPRVERPAPGAARTSLPVRVLGAALMLLLGLVLGFYLFFPADILASRIEQEVARRTPVRLVLGAVDLTFPPGLSASPVRLAGGPPLQGLPPIDAVTVKPLWSALLQGRPGAAVAVRQGQGRLDVDVVPGGPLTATGGDFPLTVPLTESGLLQARGRVRELRLESALPLGDQTRTRLELTLAEVVLEGLETVGARQDALPLGTIRLVVTGTGRAFEIESLESSGGRLEVTGDGQVIFASPLGRSRANLSIGLRPAPDLDPALTDLLGLFGQRGRDGVIRLRLRGTFAQAGLG